MLHDQFGAIKEGELHGKVFFFHDMIQLLTVQSPPGLLPSHCLICYGLTGPKAQAHHRQYKPVLARPFSFSRGTHAGCKPTTTLPGRLKAIWSNPFNLTMAVFNFMVDWSLAKLPGFPRCAETPKKISSMGSVSNFQFFSHENTLSSGNHLTWYSAFAPAYDSLMAQSNCKKWTPCLCLSVRFCLLLVSAFKVWTLHHPSAFVFFCWFVFFLSSWPDVMCQERGAKLYATDER